MSEIPQFPTHLPGELWGVTAYFNPHAIPLQLQNLQEFSERIRRQGLKLMIVELAFGDAPFAVPDGYGDRVLRRRSHSVLWQKERMLNLGIAHLPATCDKVAWLDGDLLFENDQWVTTTNELLDSYIALQLFDTACWLPRGARTITPVAAREHGDRRAVPVSWRSVPNMTPDLPRGMGEGKCLPGIIAGLIGYTTPEGRRRAMSNFMLSGHTGFAWAARRSLLAAHSLYDRDIVGGADIPIAHALLGNEDFWQGNNYYCHHLSPAAMTDIAEWGRNLYADVGGSVAFTPGRVLHLWHGDIASRNYIARLQILLDNEYDPAQDIGITADGCWEWRTDKPVFHQQVNDYFAARGVAVR